MRPAEAQRVKRANVEYHDGIAADYDAKWNIRFGGEALEMVTAKLGKALGKEASTYARALEIGAGTGYFTLNLLRAGVVGEAVAADISAGMLATLRDSADRLGLQVETVRCEAAELPFATASFDLVFGHAVLHHLPDLDAAFAEFHRVLRPGGTLIFCGEPSRHGDRLARLPKRAGLLLAPAWRRLLRTGARRNGDGRPSELDRLEAHVDVHSFTPGDLEGYARRAGFGSVRIAGEELAASWFGWLSRTLEGSADPDQVPVLWRWYAYGGYMTLRALDRALLEPRLPPAIFYNLMISARAREAR